VLCYIGQLCNGIDVGHDIFSCLRTAAVCSQILDCYYFNYVAAAATARVVKRKNANSVVCVFQICGYAAGKCHKCVIKLFDDSCRRPAPREKKRVPLFLPLAVSVPLLCCEIKISHFRCSADVITAHF
jgi:hypothetical protein